MKLGFGIEINSILRPDFVCPEAVQCILIVEFNWINQTSCWIQG